MQIVILYLISIINSFSLQISYITTINGKWPRDDFVGPSVILNNDKTYSFIEVGSTVSVQPILDYMKENNIKPEQVKNIFITHAHLDHMGGVGLLLQSLPKATIYCNQAAVSHIVNPLAKLCPAARIVYGDEQYEKDYPNVQLAPQERVVATQDGQIIDEIRCIETYGHSYHHNSYLLNDKYLFGGDSIGFGLKEINWCPLLCTSPTQYDGKAWRQSLDKMNSYPIEGVFSAHYGKSQLEWKQIYESALKQLDQYDKIIQIANNRQEVEQMYNQVISQELERFNCKLNVDQLIFTSVNVDGLWYKVQKRLAKVQK